MLCHFSVTVSIQRPEKLTDCNLLLKNLKLDSDLPQIAGCNWHNLLIYII